MRDERERGRLKGQGGNWWTNVIARLPVLCIIC
jgi:hypothetical protein